MASTTSSWKVTSLTLRSRRVSSTSTAFSTSKLKKLSCTGLHLFLHFYLLAFKFMLRFFIFVRLYFVLKFFILRSLMLMSYCGLLDWYFKLF